MPAPRRCTILELLHTEKESVNYVEADKGVRSRQCIRMRSGTWLLVIYILASTLYMCQHAVSGTHNKHCQRKGHLFPAKLQHASTIFQLHIQGCHF